MHPDSPSDVLVVVPPALYPKYAVTSTTSCTFRCAASNAAKCAANLCSCPSDQRGVIEAAPPEKTVAETVVPLSAERAMGNEEVAVPTQEHYSAEPVKVH